MQPFDKEISMDMSYGPNQTYQHKSGAPLQDKSKMTLKVIQKSLGLPPQFQKVESWGGETMALLSSSDDFCPKMWE